jgi:flagellar basal body-associated protein FliL
VTLGPKLRDALIVAGLAALIATVVVVRPPTAGTLTATVIDVRESIGRYDQDLNLQISTDAKVSFIRHKSPPRWAQADAFAATIDAKLAADPTMVNAGSLAEISKAARTFAADGRAALAALDGPEESHAATAAGVLRSGHRFESALGTYPVRWSDRLANEPLLWLVLIAVLVLTALVVAHGAMWEFGSAETRAQRDRRRIHAQLFWKTLLTGGGIVVLVALLLATHSLESAAPLVAVVALAAAGLAAIVIAEQRGREIIAVLKSQDRAPVRAAMHAPAPQAWTGPQTTIRTHVLSTIPPLQNEPPVPEVLLLSDGLRAASAESGTVRLAVEPTLHQ